MKSLITSLILVLYISAFISCGGCGNKEKTLDYEKNGFVRKYLTGARCVTYWMSDAVYYREAYYKDGKIIADSLVKEYNIDGTLAFKGHMINEFPPQNEGFCISYYPNGNVECELNYKNGKLNGPVTAYLQNGKVDVKCNYKNDKHHGNYIEYYDNGKIQRKCYLLEGVVIGEDISYYKNGKMEKYENKNSLGHGLEKEYYKNGKLKSYTQYKVFVPYGVRKEYYDTGKLKSVKNYTMGELNGKCVDYYKKGNIKKEAYYINNELSGPYKLFFPTGEIKLSGEIKNGKRVGLWIIRESVKDNVKWVDYSPQTVDMKDDVDEYRRLLDDYENYKSLLEENDIEHEELTGEMSFEDLEEMVDEYKELLDENEIDY